MPRKTLKDMIPKNELDSIVKDYCNGISLRQLENKYKHGRSSISKMLKELGYEINTVRHDKKYNFNYDFFEKINNELNAYWLGFLYADGCILTPEYGEQKIQLTLAQQDEEILIKYKNDLESTYPIRYDYSKNKKNSNNQVQVICRYSSQKTVDDLKKLGCFERKSLDLDFPKENQVPNELIYHFIRGYFDGDGSIFKTNNNYEISIVGTEKFIKKLRTYFSNLGYVSKDNRKANSWYFSIKNKDEIRTFYNLIYNNSTRYLKRKKDKFEEFNKYYESKGI